MQLPPACDQRHRAMAIPLRAPLGVTLRTACARLLVAVLVVSDVVWHVGDAAAQQPRNPLDETTKRRDFAKSPAPAATAALTDYDRKLDCKTLNIAVLDLVDQMKRRQVQAQKESRAPAPTLARLYARASGPTGAGIEALEGYAPVRVRAEALAALGASKGCDRIDVAARMGTAAVPTRALSDRCRVRSDFELEDCVEDIAQWRCRLLAGKGRGYLECLTKVGAQVITASGFEPTRLAHYDPDCTDKTYAPASCSVFSNDRNGAGTTWCKRVDEAVIEACDVADAKSVAKSGGKSGSKVGDRLNCQKVQCSLGTCKRLCAPPI